MKYYTQHGLNIVEVSKKELEFRAKKDMMIAGQAALIKLDEATIIVNPATIHLLVEK
jgi:uncharacterized protein (DUF2345 family)